MTAPNPHQRKRAIAAGAWLKAERERLGWSIEDICAQAQKMADVHMFDVISKDNPQPFAEQIEALEAGEYEEPPRWLRAAYHAIEAAELDEVGRNALRRERNHYWRGHPWDASHPMVFHNEYFLLQHLGQYTSDERRAIEQFVAKWKSAYPSKKKDALHRLARELGFEAKLPE